MYLYVLDESNSFNFGHCTMTHLLPALDFVIDKAYYVLLELEWGNKLTLPKNGASCIT